MSKVHKRFREFLADKRKLVAECYLYDVEEMLELEHRECHEKDLREYEQENKKIRRLGWCFSMVGALFLSFGLLMGARAILLVGDLIRSTIPNATSLLGPSVELGIIIIILLAIACPFLYKGSRVFLMGLTLLLVYKNSCSVCKKNYQDLLCEREKAIKRLERVSAE